MITQKNRDLSVSHMPLIATDKSRYFAQPRETSYFTMLEPVCLLNITIASQ